MSKQSYDHPNAIFHSLIPIVTIAMGITLQWLRPLASLAHWSRLVGRHARCSSPVSCLQPLADTR